MKHQCHIKHLCLQLCILLIRPQHTKEILCRGKLRVRYGYIFCHRCGNVFPERTKAWRCNIKVMQMMNDIRENVHDWSDRDEVKSYLGKMLDGQVFDKKGLIYGMGHAVYSLSDPRERVFRSYVEHLAEAKGRQKDMNLYNMIEEVAPELIAEKRHIFKGVSPNVDFYSGFVYEMLGIPSELYTPLFAIARIAGWSAHRLEELVGCNKIIRPAYKSVMEELE